MATSALAYGQASVSISGLMDITSPVEEDLRFLNQMNTRDGNFDTMRTRLFLQSGSENTQVHVQFVLSDVSFDQVRVYGAYLNHKLFEERELYVEAGRIPTHIGTWGPRAYSNRNPLIGVPLGYYWKSTLPYKQMPNDLDDLVSRSGQGQTGVVYADQDGMRGTPWATTPMVYDNCWDSGAFLLGTHEALEYAAGVTLGTPGATVSGNDVNDALTVQAKLGFSPVNELKMYASFARGAYLSHDVDPYLPAGNTVNDYLQQIWIGSMEFARGHWTLRGEVLLNSFETPLTSDGLNSTAYYLEADVTVRPGWFVAGRFDQVRFGEVTTSSGVTTWDSNVRRFEAGVGHHLTHRFLLKGVVQATKIGEGDNEIVPAVAASVGF